MQSSLFEGKLKVNINMNYQGDGIGTVDIGGKTFGLIAVSGRAFVLADNSTRWAFVPSMYGILNATISPTGLAKDFRRALTTGRFYDNETVSGVPAFMARTRAGSLYVSAEGQYRVLKIIASTGLSVPSLTELNPHRKRYLLEANNVGLSSRILLAGSLPAGTISVSDLDGYADAVADLAEAINSIVPDLKDAEDLSAQFDASANPVLACSSSSCTVTAIVSTSFVSKNLVAREVSATLTTTMTVDGVQAGGCSDAKKISVNGISTIGCVNTSPAYVSAYARAAKPRGRTARVFPILARTQVYAQAYVGKDVAKLTAKYNMIMNKVQTAKTSYLYRMWYGDNKRAWKYGITSQKQWEDAPRSLVSRCKNATGSICGYMLEGTYPTRTDAYTHQKILVKKQSLPGQLDLVPVNTMFDKQVLSRYRNIDLKDIYKVRKAKGARKKTFNETECDEYDCEKILAHGRTKSMPFRPYSLDGGHHIPSQGVFKGINPKEEYNWRTVDAIPNYFLYCCGINHNHNCELSTPCSITDFQINGYAECKRNGAKLTWDVIERVEVNAMMRQTGLNISGTNIKAGRIIPLSVAKATMSKARSMLNTRLNKRYPNQTRVDMGRYYVTGLLLGVCPRPR